MVAPQKAVNIVIKQYKVGTVDFNRVATIEQTLVQQQDQEAQASGRSARLITVYRAMGGGWEIRLNPDCWSRWQSRWPPIHPRRAAARSFRRGDDEPGQAQQREGPTSRWASPAAQAAAAGQDALWAAAGG